MNELSTAKTARTGAFLLYSERPYTIDPWLPRPPDFALDPSDWWSVELAIGRPRDFPEPRDFILGLLEW